MVKFHPEIDLLRFRNTLSDHVLLRIQNNFAQKANLVLFQNGMRRGQSSNWNPVRRTRHIVQAEPVAEDHRGRVSAMLTADPKLDITARGFTALGRCSNQLANAFLIDRHKWIFLIDPLLFVRGQEPARIIT